MTMPDTGRVLTSSRWEALHVIHHYIRIAKRRATEEKGIVVRTPTHPKEQLGVDENAQLSDIAPS